MIQAWWEAATVVFVDSLLLVKSDFFLWMVMIQEDVL